MYVSGCYLGVYAGLGGIQILLTIWGTFLLALSAIFASHILHSDSLRNILRSPLSFFDTTPVSWILSHFSVDVYVIDEVIPRSIHSFIFTFLTLLSSFILITIVTPIFAVVLIPLIMLYLMIQVRSFIFCRRLLNDPFNNISSFTFNSIYMLLHPIS